MRGLSKRYGRVSALEDLTLQVTEGEVLGFLGPNGAGKTTTIRLLLGLLHPSAGTATVLGHPIGPAGVPTRGNIGYLPGELALWPQLTGRRTLVFLGALSGRPTLDQCMPELCCVCRWFTVRTMAKRSACLARLGRSCETWMPVTLVAIGLNGPRMESLALGFGSQRSIWLGAPELKIKMIDFALPSKF